MLGYLGFWSKIFDELGIEMNEEFSSFLTARDKKKTKKDFWQKSTEGKSKQRKDYCEQFEQLHKDQMKDAKSGKGYGWVLRWK